MRWQRNMSQVKEQDETPEEQVNKVDTDNLLEKQLRVMITKMIHDLEKRMGQVAWPAGRGSPRPGDAEGGGGGLQKKKKQNKQKKRMGHREDTEMYIKDLEELKNKQRFTIQQQK